MLSTPTIDDRLRQTGGRAAGFDYMRIILAVSVILVHGVITSYGSAANMSLFASAGRPIFRFILPAFFALSGFLVAGSLERSKTLTTFIGLRIIRIYPALICEVVLSALVIGPLLTTRSWHDYFQDRQFLTYLLNALGDVHYALPGVFAQNPLPSVVNGQLWTVPFELYCYCGLALMVMLGLRRTRIIAPIASVAVILAYLAVTLARHGMAIVPVFEAVNGAILIASFLAGVSIHIYRDRLPWSLGLCVASILLSVLCLTDLRYGSFFVAFPCAYVTVYVGLLDPSRKYLFGGDYAYGVFLYGFVIQQTLMRILPAPHAWFLNVLLTVPLAFGVAAVSWRFVEKPAQRLRFILKRIEALELGRASRMVARRAMSAALSRNERRPQH